jgi:hypothetical protein
MPEMSVVTEVVPVVTEMVPVVAEMTAMPTMSTTMPAMGTGSTERQRHSHRDGRSESEFAKHYSLLQLRGKTTGTEPVVGAQRILRFAGLVGASPPEVHALLFDQKPLAPSPNSR